ncbi:hypothetical protein HED60_18355 [Planctomycetales bacterium ZRK34]|nr:hypothetical protein HED60_18355 [Planctomycetales bacterium ZRK34]
MKSTTHWAWIVAFCLATGGLAHETDHFTVTPGREFADLGPQLSVFLYDRIERGVQTINQQIQRARKAGDDETVKQLQNPASLVAAVHREMPDPYSFIENVGRDAETGVWNDRYPGRIVGFKPGLDNVYLTAALPVDPRTLFKFWFAPVIKTYGVYIGTDKLGHFIGMGWLNYQEFIARRQRGEPADQAMTKTIQATESNPILSESGILGIASSGAYSNADLASDFMGMMFFRNLTEPVKLKGEMRPAMVQRDGDGWKLAPHVYRGCDLLSWFVSDHWDEALNPSLFDGTMQGGMKRAIQQRSAGLLWRYRDDQGGHRTPEYFTQKAKELSTLWGLDYGHKTGNDELITLAVCFEPASSNSPAANEAGYTPLHLATMRGDLAQVEKLIQRGDDVNAPLKCLPCDVVMYGSTPLHLAAAQNHVQVMARLIEAGADASHPTPAGVRPIHRAAAHPEALSLLIERGVDVKATDGFGRSAMHWAAMADAGESINLLLAQGLTTDVRDVNDATPLHRAAAAGADAAVSVLLDRGADLQAADRLGLTPLHSAAAAHRETTVKLLLDHHASPTATDDLGWTPLQLAARAGDASIVRMLKRHAAAEPAVKVAGDLEETP